MILANDRVVRNWYTRLTIWPCVSKNDWHHFPFKNLYVKRHIAQPPNEICESVRLQVWICQKGEPMATVVVATLQDDAQLLIVQVHHWDWRHPSLARRMRNLNQNFYNWRWVTLSLWSLPMLTLGWLTLTLNRVWQHLPTRRRIAPAPIDDNTMHLLFLLRPFLFQNSLQSHISTPIFPN